MNSTSQAQSLEKWMACIHNKEMPIFGKTVQSVLGVTTDDMAPAPKLAKVVLRDASMTARVLKLVNTIYYNPSRNSVCTVSRAVVLMGFETIRNICLSISLVDSLVSGDAKDLLTQELGRAIHAAVQAKDLAILMKDPAPEEIFVATLLYNIGEMAFWCFGGDSAKEVARLMKVPGYSPERAQLEVLGFRLVDLTSALVKDWGINQLLCEALSSKAGNNPRLRSLSLSHELAQLAETAGWESEAVEAHLKKTAKLLNLEPDKLTQHAHRNAQQAFEIAGFYGASSAALSIPLPGKEKKDKLVQQVESLKVSAYPEPDPMLQLRILRELSQVIEKKVDFTLIMGMVMEGIHRGIGLDRALFALLTPDRKGLVGKFALGPNADALTRNFRFNRASDPDNVFFASIDNLSEYWVDLATSSRLQPFVTPAIQQTVGRKPFFVGALVVSGKSIGLLYADRSQSGRSLDEDSFNSFRHFATEAGLILGQGLARKR